MMTRRAWLGATACAAGAWVGNKVLADGGASTPAAGATSIRFLAFADLHYCPGEFTHDDRAWLERILARAEEAKAAFVIHAGDFVHDPVRQAAFVNFYNDFHLPTYHTLGNHDTERCTLAQTLAAYRLERGHYHFDRGGFRFVVLDTNYFREGKRFVHFEGNNYRPIPRDRSWTLSEEEYAWAEQTIAASPHPCVVFMHQSCEREQNGMPDWARLRGIFRWINRHKGNKVRLVVNGHHHTDGLRIIDGIPYLDLNSANYKYYAQAHRLYGADYHKTHTGAGNVIAWSDPLSAVITLSTDGDLAIEGVESTFFKGVSPEMAHFPPRDRDITPRIQSVRLKMR